MRFRQLQILVLAIFAVLPCWVLGAEPPRLAIVSMGSGSAHSDLVFAKLSGATELALVERDKLRTITAELTLDSGTRESSMKAGSLLGAQGLLFIHQKGGLRYYTLVETGKGERLIEMARPSDEPVQEKVAEQVCQMVKNYASQLSAIGREEALRIAVFPFQRADGRWPAWHDLDVLTVLVANTLARHPNLIVVERQNLTDVMLEPLLSGSSTKSLSTADFVLRAEGNRLDDDRLQLNVRLESSDSGSIEAFSLTSDPRDLQSCANQILHRLAGKTGSGELTRRVEHSEEAALHYQRATIIRAQQKSSYFHFFELAYELAPGNRTYAKTYLDLLLSRSRGSGSLGVRSEYFMRALDVAKRLDPGMNEASLPLPPFLYSMSRNPESVQPTKVILFPMDVPDLIGTMEEKEIRRIIAIKLSMFPHLEVLFGDNIDEACHAASYDPASSERVKVAYSIANELGGAILLMGSAKLKEEGGVKLNMGLSWNPWKATGKSVNGDISQLESLAGELARGLAASIPADPARPLTDEEEICRDSRIQIENYYKTYCGYGEGLPDSSRFNQWVRICPLFFDEPDQALAYLRTLTKREDFQWSAIVGHPYLSVKYWDRKRAQELWLNYLEELLQNGSLQARFQALRALSHFNGTQRKTQISQRPSGKDADASKRLFDWLCQEHVHEEYLSGEISLSSHEFWGTFWYLDLDSQDAYWDWLVVPRLRKLIPSGGSRTVEVSSFSGHLIRRYRYNKERPGEKERIEGYVEQAREIVAVTLGERNKRCERILDDVLRTTGKIERLPPPPRDFTFPEIEGAELVFDFYRDVGDDAWRSYDVIRASPLIHQNDEAWIGYTSQKNGSHGKGWITLLSFGPEGEVVSTANISATGIGYGFFRIPVQIAKTKDVVCLAELGNVVAVPVDSNGVFEEENAIFLSRGYGLPGIGGRAKKISGLGAHGDYIYIAVDSPSRLIRGPYYGTKYGALYRWKPGMKEVETVTAAHSLAAGPLNDCQPYSIRQSYIDDDEKSIMFFVKWGPREGWWRYTPDEDKWNFVGEVETPQYDTGRWITSHKGRPLVYRKEKEKFNDGK